MPMKYRLSSVVCQELAEAKGAQDAFLQEVDRAARDGRITPDEWKRILQAERTMIREMHEAIVASEQHDLVLAKFEYALRVGVDAPLHQHLRQKEADVAALSGTRQGKVTMRLIRKAPTASVARRMRHDNKRVG